MILNFFKLLLSNAIPIMKKLGYTDEEIKAGIDETAKILPETNLISKSKAQIIKVLEEVKNEMK